MSENEFLNNTTTGSGGAIALGGAAPRIQGNRFNGNQARNGGAIYSSGGNAEIRDNTFENNKATAKGGAISNHGGSITTIEGNVFESNEGAYGGAIFCYSSTLAMSSNTYQDNEPATNRCNSNCTGCVSDHD